MGWIKLGLLFTPDKKQPWMHSHCQLPVADHIGGDIFRIYFASRTLEQRSHISFVDINILNPKIILNVSSYPVLSPGPIGFFDEHGVYPSCIVNHNNKKHLYYIGWNQGVEPPLFYASIGLAVSDDGGKSFYRFSKAPVMSRSDFDPTLVTSPHVYIENGIWRMTYVSGIKWQRTNNVLKSYYHIKYAESMDGLNWIRNGTVAIDFQSNKETNIARSWVIKEGGLYKMWYSYVLPPKSYRIGYAESADGKTFIRKDHLSGLDTTAGEFDSEMMCYPNIVIHKGIKYMFYNGNNFGAEGFGLAFYK